MEKLERNLVFYKNARFLFLLYLLKKGFFRHQVIRPEGPQKKLFFWRTEFLLTIK
ncbi:hypothetical protein CHY_0888 [Carboxydothermus hydrogenoformans Z-2901]|uniref:Uncharacterized protein n=1 Tax=Carboxydothermus hydrogenoformans (strain ATCC BAA-161 / DSM 6008 / Z-2901) TaxID=246194 RepID=Q3ADP6_CARHZ|nr:hypothetical protein CHY_0888 [Carboxydothermus hydrogenoformans Z-2901]